MNADEQQPTRSRGLTAEMRALVALLIGLLVFIGATSALLVWAEWRGVGGDSAESSTTGLQSADFSLADQQVAEIPDGLPGIQVGESAPPFTLPDLSGNNVSLADFAGRPVIVNFWATWCAPCRIEMPEFETAFQTYGDDGLVILALNQDESAEIVSQYFYDEMQLSFTPLLDTRFGVAAEYGAVGIYPSTYFVAPDGTVTAVHRGPVTLDVIELHLARMGFPG